MKSVFIVFLIIIMSLFSSACQNNQNNDHLKNVGLLLSGTINEEIWGQKGYKALIDIGKKYKVDTYYREDVNTKRDTVKALKTFQKQGVNLVFGHGAEFASVFMQVKDQFPKIHFVIINGTVTGKHISSLHFEGKAMGFFGGMVAAKMSKTGVVAVIAAYPWQPEVDGFIEGALYQNSNTKVKVEYVKDWDNVKVAKEKFEALRKMNADIYYPAGDGFNIPVMEEIKSENLHAIGYVSDQSNLGKKFVLTSTVQDVEKLYNLAAEKFNNGKLESGNLYYDFDDGVIFLGKYSPDVPKDYQNYIEQLVDQYKKTNKLPFEAN